MSVNTANVIELIKNSGILPKITTLAVLIGQWQLEHIGIRRFDEVIEEQVPVIIETPRTAMVQIGFKRGDEGTRIPEFDTRTVIDRRTVFETRQIIKKKTEFKYLSTEEISDLRNTGLSPPILTTAARLADATADTAIAALKTAEGFINSVGGVGGTIGEAAGDLGAQISRASELAAGALSRLGRPAESAT